MRLQKVIGLALAIAMIATLFAPVAEAAGGGDAGIDLNASIKEPRPEIGITVDVDHIAFGELLPGEASDSYPVAVTNIGLKTIGVSTTVDDDGIEEIFAEGITVNGGAWDEYFVPLIADRSDSFDVALHVPDTVTTRGNISGSMIVWAEEKANIYSTAMANTNPGAPDPGIPGFVGPDGDGVITTQRLSGAIPSNNYVNSIFTAWASKVIDYYRSDVDPSHTPPYQYLSQALGPVTGSNMHIVTLGDLDQAMIDAGSPPGSLTLGFDVVIVNGPGPDFACFENGFIISGTNNIFAELGYVEVSTDGITFARFPSVSLTTGEAGGYGGIDATGVYNLVGKHVNAYGDSWGTSFDLSDLINEPEVLSGAVNLDNINFVRIVDIPGSGDFKDSLGNPIYDAWPTHGTGGLDFEALGVINSHAKQIIAGFSISPLSGNAPLTVHFTDQSVNATSWAWDFDNDGTVDSNEQNPTYTYNAPRTYTVKLTASNSAGSDIEIKRNLITVSSPPGDFIYTSTDSAITITGYKGAGGDVVIPGEIGGLPVVAIGASAFNGNTNMTSVNIPDSVTSIGGYAFRDCTALTSVTIGSGVTSISVNAFTGCTALTAINVDGANIAYTSVDGVVYNKDVTTLAYCPLGKSGSVNIPSSVTSIPANAFSGCTALTSVTIPDSVTSLGNYAFQGCTALTSVTISDNLTSIGFGVFQGCTALTSVVIPDSVTNIGIGVFQGCTALTSVTIGSGVTSITSSIFTGCTALTAINVDAANANYKSIDGVVYNKAGTTLVYCPLGKSGSLNIPDSVTSIGNNAFYGCTALTSIVIPDSVTSIGNLVFSGCTALTSIVIPDSVTSIGSSVFRDCTALTLVIIGSNVTSIGAAAFNGCTALTTMTFEGNAPSVGTSWAQNVPSTMIVYYHEGAGFVILDGKWNGFTAVQLP